FVGQGGKLCVYFENFAAVKPESELLITSEKGVPAGMLTQDYIVFRHPDGFWRHDLIAKRIVQHAVLMNTGFMCERIASDNGLIRLNAEADNRREKLACRIELRRLDIIRVGHFVAAYGTCHHYFFQRCVSGPLADTVYCAFDLPGAGVECGQ